MTSTLKTDGFLRIARRALPLALSALGLGASLPALAQEQVQDTVAAPTATQPDVIRTQEGPLTRAQVLESLRSARAANLMSPATEMGDSPEVLAARETFYALQTEVLLAEYAAAQAQAQAQAEREQQAQQLSQLEQTQAEAGTVPVVLMEGPSVTGSDALVLLLVEEDID